MQHKATKELTFVHEEPGSFVGAHYMKNSLLGVKYILSDTFVHEEPGVAMMHSHIR